MALSRGQLIDAAIEILHEGGLASLSMRNIAKRLDVQPGALYWHVKSKQDLLALVAERILAPDAAAAVEPSAAEPSATATATASDDAFDARAAAVGIRTALLSVRDGAEIVSLTNALQPGSLAPLRQLRALLGNGPDRDSLTAQQSEWGARVLSHYILGAVAEEQNRAELVRAGVLPAEAAERDDLESYLFGVDVILSGLTSAGVASSAIASGASSSE